MSLEACLPTGLRGASTTINKVAAGLSGAGVYRVEAVGQTFVLKVAGEDESLPAWRSRLHIRQLAANAGLAPRIVHTDEVLRAVVSAFVVDRSFLAFYGSPQAREAAVALLGRTLRRVHELPLPREADSRSAREFLATVWSGPVTTFALPAFVGDAVRRVLTEEEPALERAPVLSHNDVNPTNLVYDGESLLLVDWDTAGANDPFYDLAAISVFARMDEGTCRGLLAAYDGAPVAGLPARFVYSRRLVAVLCGTILLNLARQSGHAGATGAETLGSVPSLADFYQRIRAGSLSMATGEGQWWFGLALMRESAGL